MNLFMAGFPRDLKCASVLQCDHNLKSSRLLSQSKSHATYFGTHLFDFRTNRTQLFDWVRLRNCKIGGLQYVERMARFSYQSSICHLFLLLTFVYQVQHSFCLNLTFVFQVQHSFCSCWTFVLLGQHSFYCSSSSTFVLFKRDDIILTENESEL